MHPDEIDSINFEKTLETSGFNVRERVYDASRELPARRRDCATLCLTIEGGYRANWPGAQLQCGPAALLFHPPGDVYGARISDAGSRCMTISIDADAFGRIAGALPDIERLDIPRRAVPHWLVFQLRHELEAGDDLSGASIEGAVIALLADRNGPSGIEVRGAPPPWLDRVQERIHDEFNRGCTLDSLAQTAGVHHVHLAREFHRRFGCTVGHYIRQRRIEFACGRLANSRASLSDIALDAGFADQSHFANVFRRFVDVSPGVFRRRFARL